MLPHHARASSSMRPTNGCGVGYTTLCRHKTFMVWHFLKEVWVFLGSCLSINSLVPYGFLYYRMLSGLLPPNPTLTFRTQGAKWDASGYLTILTTNSNIGYALLCTNAAPTTLRVEVRFKLPNWLAFTYFLVYPDNVSSVQNIVA